MSLSIVIGDFHGPSTYTLPGYEKALPFPRHCFNVKILRGLAATLSLRGGLFISLSQTSLDSLFKISEVRRRYVGRSPYY